MWHLGYMYTTQVKPTPTPYGSQLGKSYFILSLAFRERPFLLAHLKWHFHFNIFCGFSMFLMHLFIQFIMEDKTHGINILIVTQLQPSHNSYLLTTNNYLTSYLLTQLNLRYYLPTTIQPNLIYSLLNLAFKLTLRLGLRLRHMALMPKPCRPCGIRLGLDLITQHLSYTLTQIQASSLAFKCKQNILYIPTVPCF